MKSRLVFFVIAAAAILSFSCGADENGNGDGNGNGNGVTESNVLTVDGTDYALGTMFYEDSGTVADGSRITIYLAAPGSTAEEVSCFHDHDYYVMLVMYFPGSDISSGTFVFSTESDSHTFSDWSLVNVGGQLGSYHYAEGGTVEVTVDGSNYTIQGDLSVDPGPTASFHFEGSAVEFD